MKIGKTTVEVDINVVLRGDKRIMDLLRHQRMELFQVGLITEDEYAFLSGQRGAVERLETYDVLRKERDELKRLIDARQDTPDMKLRERLMRVAKATAEASCGPHDVCDVMECHRAPDLAGIVGAEMKKGGES